MATKRLLTHIPALPFAVLAGGLAFATATTAVAANTISKIDVGATNGAATTRLRVMGTAAPDFTTYRLHNPERVIIEVSGAAVKGVPGEIAVNTAAVKSIAVKGPGGFGIATVTVYPAGAVQYYCTTEGSTLVVDITAMGGSDLPGSGPQTAPETVIAAAPSPTPAPEPAAEPAPAPAPESAPAVAAAPESGDGKELIDDDAEPIAVAVAPPAPPPAAPVPPAPAPSLVAAPEKPFAAQPSLDTVTPPPAGPTVQTASAAKPVLLAQAEEEIEEEFEDEAAPPAADKAAPALDKPAAEAAPPPAATKPPNDEDEEVEYIDEDDEAAFFSPGSQPETAQEKAASPSAPAAAPAFTKPKYDEGQTAVTFSAGSTRRMTFIGFKQYPQISRVYVNIDGIVDAQVFDAGPDKVVMELSSTQVPKMNNRRFLDTRFFASAVTMITPRVEGEKTRIEIKLRETVPYDWKQESGVVYIDFVRPQFQVYKAKVEKVELEEIE